MDLMGGFYPVFLCVLWLRAAAGYVEQPTNVTLHCHNLHNVLGWSHNQLSTPGLRFKVDIGSVLKISPSVLWVNSTPPLQVDLSSLSDPSNDYYLTVTAVIGQNESEPAPQNGLSFSYYQDSLAEQKCFVDLPPVNVTAQDDHSILFRFTHPWNILKPKLKKKKRNDFWMSKELPVFKYSVVITNQKEYPHSFSCVESVCEKKLAVDAAQEKHCLMVTGELQKMIVKATQEYCALPLEKPDYTYVYIVLFLASTAMIVALVVFMVFRRKTKSLSSLPDSVTFGERVKRLTMQVVQEQIFVPEVEPTTPTQLLIEQTESTPTVTPSPEQDLRLSIGIEDEDGSDVVTAGDAEGSLYTHGRHFDEEEEPQSSEPASGYERREVLVEVGPDELVKGYRG
ncbi:interferon gamma receptor 1-like [Pempheris klunzingeri]|uniref:interferon gamma receptor 1-like n=1 Tax=Pempheris klunzingeri TaxID=3127111 RepID=UPI00398165E7